MLVDIQEMVETAGLKEKIYPGKKLLKPFVRPGEYKSHCVVFDWRGERLKVELKAGLSGNTLDAATLRNYPVSYQAPTFFELEDVRKLLENRQHKDEDEEEDGRGKSSAGGGLKSKGEKELSLSAFDEVTEGRLPETAEIKKFVVMGRTLAENAFAQAYENFIEQVQQTKMMAIDMLKNVDNLIQKATPGGGLQAKGNESMKYQYDAEKTAALFGGMAPG